LKLRKLDVDKEHEKLGN